MSANNGRENDGREHADGWSFELIFLIEKVIKHTGKSKKKQKQKHFKLGNYIVKSQSSLILSV